MHKHTISRSSPEAVSPISPHTYTNTVSIHTPPSLPSSLWWLSEPTGLEKAGFVGWERRLVPRNNTSSGSSGSAANWSSERYSSVNVTRVQFEAWDFRVRLRVKPEKAGANSAQIDKLHHSRFKVLWSGMGIWLSSKVIDFLCKQAAGWGVCFKKCKAICVSGQPQLG